MMHFRSGVRQERQEPPISNKIDAGFSGGEILFAFFCLSLALVYWSPLVSLFHLALQNDYCTHILFVPAVSAFLLYLNRRRIFHGRKSSHAAVILILLAGAGLYRLAAKHLQISLSTTCLPQTVLLFVLLVIAGFICCFGTPVLRKAAFPLVFLLLMVPLPTVALNKLIYMLQAGTCTIAYQLFHVLEVPVFRDRFVFELPGFTVEVAKECSSIRSSLALFITGLLAAHLYLRKPWTRFILVVITVPLAVFKNAVRIVTLCVLAIHVNAGFLTGKLHRDGGAVFYAGTLLILGAFLQVLRSAEKQGARPDDSLPQRSDLCGPSRSLLSSIKNIR